MQRLILTLAVTAALVSPALAQCPNGKCIARQPIRNVVRGAAHIATTPVRVIRRAVPVQRRYVQPQRHERRIRIFRRWRQRAAYIVPQGQRYGYYSAPYLRPQMLDAIAVQNNFRFSLFHFSLFG